MTEKKLFLAKRTQEQLQEILLRKQNLSLNLRCAMPASSDQSLSTSEMTSDCDLKSFQDINNRKLQIASALDLLPQNIPSSIDTMETFHTAAADSPEPRILFEESVTKQTTDFIKTESKNSEEQEKHYKDTSPLMQECRKSPEVENKNIINLNKTAFIEGTNHEEQEISSSLSMNEENILQNSLESFVQEDTAMKRLNQRIAQQRIILMRCLETDTSKENLNQQIMILQDLQKQQIELELSLLENERKSQKQSQYSDDSLIASEAKDYVQNVPNTYCSVESTDNSSTVLYDSDCAITRSQYFRNNRSNVSDQETSSIVPKISSNRGYSTVYLTVSSYYISFF